MFSLRQWAHLSLVALLWISSTLATVHHHQSSSAGCEAHRQAGCHDRTSDDRSTPEPDQDTCTVCQYLSQPRELPQPFGPPPVTGYWQFTVYRPLPPRILLASAAYDGRAPPLSAARPIWVGALVTCG